MRKLASLKIIFNDIYLVKYIVPKKYAISPLESRKRHKIKTLCFTSASLIESARTAEFYTGSLWTF